MRSKKPSPDAREADALPGTLRVLVVDDDRTLAKTLGCMIELLEHKVEFAYDGAKALATAESFLPDVVLLDIGLPGMDGHEVCQKMRANEKLSHCTLVALTGRGQKEDRQLSKASGFDHHLVKPVKLETLEQLFSPVD